MNITSVATNIGGAVQDARQQWQIKSVEQAPPLRFFRHILYLRFPIGHEADRILIDETSTVLKGLFEPFEYNALDQSAVSPPASLIDSGSAIIVNLDGPRQVLQVRLSPGKTSGTNYSLEFYRIDQDKLSDNPTTAASIQNDIAAPSSDFTDVRFAVKLKNPSGSFEPLTAANILDIRVRSYPTGARLGLAEPEALSSTVLFKILAGEVKGPPPAVQGNVEAGAELRQALERHLTAVMERNLQLFLKELSPSSPRTVNNILVFDSNAPLPDHIDVALVFESDAPCRFSITEFNIAYNFALETFPARDEKQVLRFAADRVTSQEVFVQLARNANVSDARIKITESFRNDRQLSAAATSPIDAPLPQGVGAQVGVDRWVAQSFTPSETLSVSGIALALMNLSDKTELLVEVRKDGQGQPSGERLAQAKVTLESVGDSAWIILLFSKPIVVQSQTHWILAKAASGQVVWLADPGSTPLRIFENSSENTWREISILTGIQGLRRFISPGSQAQGQPVITLSIGSERLIAENGNTESGAKTFEIASELNAYLASQPDTQTIVRIPLVFTANLGGIITVYPPHIEYGV